ncbi:hypothetical protein O9A_00579 [Bartonella koehlerae C-29]|uniref:Uncharacterized protein n=1 Tax=Bartonella koehlerae C-29 TaxID=1134510 RepID=A0A067W6A2_9HYPH|nr:hypothetical protein O9A_00579 [Bartonella koehlerae C-29]
MRALKPKLQVYNVYRDRERGELNTRCPNDTEINMALVLYNFTKQIIKINYIEYSRKQLLSIY